MTPAQILDLLVQAGVAFTYGLELLHRAVCALSPPLC